MHPFESDYRGYAVFPHASKYGLEGWQASFVACQVRTEATTRDMLFGSVGGGFPTADMAIAAAMEYAPRQIDRVLAAA